MNETNNNEQIYINPVLYFGSPSDLSGRTEVECATYRFLDRLGIQYQRLEHGPAMTIKACENIDRILGTPMCKNLFLMNRQKTDFYLLLLPGNKSFRTKDLSAQIQTARLSFAEEEYMQKYLHILPGSVSVMGLMNDTEHHVRLLIDEDLLKDEYICCHPCVNTASLKIRFSDLVQLFLPAVHHEYTAVRL